MKLVWENQTEMIWAVRSEFFFSPREEAGDAKVVPTPVVSNRNTSCLSNNITRGVAGGTLSCLWRSFHRVRRALPARLLPVFPESEGLIRVCVPSTEE